MYLVRLDNDGNFQTQALAPHETNAVRVLGSITTQQLLDQQTYEVETNYTDADGERMERVTISGTIRSLMMQ